MLRRVSVRSNENLLQGGQQLVVLVACANRGPNPTRDRLTIVMADQDLALTHRRNYAGRRLGRFGKDEVTRRGNDVEPEPPQVAGEILAILHHRLNKLSVEGLVFNRRDGAQAGQSGRELR